MKIGTRHDAKFIKQKSRFLKVMQISKPIQKGHNTTHITLDKQKNITKKSKAYILGSILIL